MEGVRLSGRCLVRFGNRVDELSLQHVCAVSSGLRLGPNAVVGRGKLGFEVFHLLRQSLRLRPFRFQHFLQFGLLRQRAAPHLRKGSPQEPRT